MILTDILSSERVRVAVAGSDLKTKDGALRVLGELLGAGDPLPAASAEFYRVLSEREALQSTGIGDGVAIRTVPWSISTDSLRRCSSVPMACRSTPSTGVPCASCLPSWGPSGRPASTSRPWLASHVF